MQAEIEQLISEKTACITPITNRNSGSRSCRPSSGTSTRFCAGTSRTAERSRAMSDNCPTWTTASTGGRGGWYMSAVTTMRGTACYWTTGSLACASEHFLFPHVPLVPCGCPALDGELAAALLCRGSRKRCAVCGAAFVPKSNRGKYCPDCAGRMKKIKAAERKRKQRQRCHAFRAFQTRINQGFFRGCQRVRDTFILFPRETAF